MIRGLESGANNFICKPYEDRALLAPRVRTPEDRDRGTGGSETEGNGGTSIRVPTGAALDECRAESCVAAWARTGPKSNGPQLSKAAHQELLRPVEFISAPRAIPRLRRE